MSARATLRIVGAAPADTLAPMPESIGASLIPASAGDALRAALSTNAALNAAVENVRAGQAQVDSRRAANQPRLDLRARQAVDRNLDGVNGTTREGVVELVLNYNLYRGGADQARIRQAADELNLSKDLREKACRDLRQTLSIAYNDSQRLSEQLGYLDQHQLSIEKAREAYRRQFDIGQRTLLDLLDTENEYFQARRAYVNARYDLVLAQARTLAGMGTLMRALDVAREDMRTQAELGAEQEALDPASICPARGADAARDRQEGAVRGSAAGGGRVPRALTRSVPVPPRLHDGGGRAVQRPLNTGGAWRGRRPALRGSPRWRGSRMPGASRPR